MSVSQPTLVSSATTITLPFPARSAQTRATWETVGGSRLTANGSVRSWSIGYRYRYALTFEYCDTNTYDAIVDMYWSSNSNQTTVTFNWSGGPWNDAASGVEVQIDSISELLTPYPDPTKADFTIFLVEVDPRTS